jgi:DNA-binding NtrC family response regulator
MLIYIKPRSGRGKGASVVRKVLIVDDEPLVLSTTAALLADGGFEVCEARGYDEAIRRLESDSDCDVLVTDISLAGRPDGIALARAVAERWPHVRVVIVSGAVRPQGGDYPERAVFFTKPYAPGALLSIVGDGEAW